MNMNSNGMDWTRNTNTNASSRYPFLQDEYDDDDRDQDEQEDEPWTVPDRAAMQKRWAFRESILRDTVDHRRIHAHGGNGDTGRNILYILRDRERHGPDGLTLRHARQVKRYEQKGDRSPSTVFESPISTTQTLETTNHNPPVGLRLPKSQSRDHDHDDSKERLPRRVSYPLKIVHEIRTFGEYFSATKYHSSFLHHLGGDDELDENGNRPASSNAVSTISVAFSPDAQTMASTHGDHSVKITSCTTGRLLQALEGHPRTPWTVKYHPKDPRIVASGCLGHQVRIWNWEEKTCLQMVRLEFAIISLSFHPTGKLLAVANGTRLHFWGIDDPDEAPARSNNRASLLTEMDQRHMLRCVHFPPDGKSIIIGGVNPTTEDPRRRTRGGIGGGGGMSFYLRMWDFDPETALQPYSDSVTVGSFMTRRAISNVSECNMCCVCVLVCWMGWCIGCWMGWCIGCVCIILHHEGCCRLTMLFCFLFFTAANFCAPCTLVQRWRF
jgi:activator-of-BECN1-regulated-autophagy protein 1